MKRLVRKEFLQNLGILCGSILFCLIAAEIMLRIFHPMTLNAHQKYPQGLVCKRHPLFGWIGQPNASGTLPGAAEDMDDMHIVMNKDGFWDSNHQISKSPGTKRLLFLGDSFTSGYAIDKKERFTDLIAHRLPSEYELINMGMWGYSTDQELLVLDEIALKYDPDVVILSMFLDDLFCSRLFSVNDGLYIKPRFTLAKNGVLEISSSAIPNNHGRWTLLNLALTRFYKLRNRMAVGREFDHRGWFSIFDKAYLKQEGYYLTLRLLSEINAILQAHDIDFLLVIIPYKDQLYEHQIYARGAEYAGIPLERLDLALPQRVVGLFCRKTGIPVLDLLPVFKKRGCPGKFFFEHDLHWTKAGHSLAAEQILTCLQELNYL